MARDIFTLCHYPIVLGIIFFAVAAKKTVEHPGEPLTGAGRFALAAGIGFFLVGFALARYRVLKRIAWERVAAAVAALAAVFVLAVRRPPRRPSSPVSSPGSLLRRFASASSEPRSVRPDAALNSVLIAVSSGTP